MHELAATQSVLTTALELMRVAGAARVTALELTSSASGHLTEDAIRQHFAALARGTPAQGAALTFVWLPATYQCYACLSRFESTAPPAEVACPACGAVALAIEHDDIERLTSIEVEGVADEGAMTMDRAPALPGI
jgi:hydrogenase nickel incorporation protein HypA/HybF